MSGTDNWDDRSILTATENCVVVRIVPEAVAQEGANKSADEAY
jgi:hypothetical protein